MASELERQLLSLKPGDHVCPIFENQTERLAVAIPFIQQGLSQQERCLYVADDATTRQFNLDLAHAGVDVADHLQRGVLRLVSARDLYLRFGEFTPQAMIDFVRGQEAEAIAEGRPGLRMLSEMTWALGAEIGSERLIVFEALLNDFMHNSRTVAVCQYDRNRFDPTVVYDMLRTHHLVILGEKVCRNPFYEPPHMVLGGVSSIEQVDWKIAQLKRAHSAEQINQERHALLQTVVEGTKDAIFVKDRQGRYLMINSAGAQVLGKSIEEVLGKDDLELFTPETALSIMEDDRRIMAIGRAETIEEARTAAGVVRIWLTAKGPYCDQQGEVVGVMGIAREITESKRLQTERDALLQRLRLQIERLPLAYILWDAGHRVLDWNPAAERMFGYSKAESLGRIVFELVDSAPLSDELQELVRRLEAGDMQTNNVNENRTRDGCSITCEWFNTPLIGPDGKITGVISLAQDITEWRLADDALRQYAERLQSLSRRVIEVQEEERRHLARELHDEIGQVLSAISVDLQVVIGSCDTAVRPRLEKSIGIVNQAIQQVRNLSLELRPSMLDDLGLISTLRWFADQRSRQAGYVLHFSAESTGRPAPADIKTACYRVVQEALTNVVRHARASQVWLIIGMHEDEVRLEIRDDGVGFDVASAREKAGRGTSFGVLAMKERVELLDGTIEIQSRPGYGTTIRVRFPIEPRNHK